jgi:hypothetical protein
VDLVLTSIGDGVAIADASGESLCFKRAARDMARPEDIACRFGGEELVLIMPDTTGHSALAGLLSLSIG